MFGCNLVFIPGHAVFIHILVSWGWMTVECLCSVLCGENWLLIIDWIYKLLIVVWVDRNILWVEIKSFNQRFKCYTPCVSVIFKIFCLYNEVIFTGLLDSELLLLKNNSVRKSISYLPWYDETRKHFQRPIHHNL